MLPNPNPSGAATSDMMALSFQKSTMYAVQSIDENIRGLRKLFASVLKVNTENLNLAKKQETTEKLNRARERAAAAEEKRESKFGTTLKSAATGVKDKAIEVGKGISLGGVLSTLLGGALLAAIFAPDKFDKMVGQIKELSSTVLDSKFFEGVAETAWGIMKKNLELDNLFVSTIFGWRAGAIYSAFDYMGEKLVESMGLKVVKGDDDNVELGQKIENFIAENLPLAFGAGGLFAYLFPGTFFNGIRKLTLGVGSVLSGTIKKAFGLGVEELTEAAAETAANNLIDPKDKTDLEKSAKKTRGRLRTSFKNLFRIGIRGFGIAGAVFAAYELTSFIIEKSSEEMEEYKKKAAEVEELGKTIGQAVRLPKFEVSQDEYDPIENDENTFDYESSSVEAREQRVVTNEIARFGMGLGNNIAVNADVGGEAAGKTQNERISKQLEGLKDLDWKQGQKFLNTFVVQATSTGASLTEGDFKTIVDWIKTLPAPSWFRAGIPKGRVFSYYAGKLQQDSFGTVKIGPNRKDARYRLEEAKKESKSSTAPTPMIVPSSPMGDQENKTLSESVEKATEPVEKAVVTKELEEIDNQILEKQNQIEKAKKIQKAEAEGRGSSRARGIERKEREIEELLKRREELTRGNDASPMAMGYQGNFMASMGDLGNYLSFEGEGQTMAPTYKAGSLRMNSLEAEMVSMNNATKPPAPIAIASPSTSSPTSVDQSQTIINNSNRQTTISGGISQYTQSPTSSYASRFSAAYT